MREARTIVYLCGLFAVGIPYGQAQTGKLPEFEVATLKPADPNVVHMVGFKIYPGGRVTGSAFSLKGLIAAAFRLSYWQISGGDSWIDKDQYELEAKPPASLQPSFTNLRYSLFGIEDEHLREMLQALLIDRFQLKFHRETKEGIVYLLERSDKPLSMRASGTDEERAKVAGDANFSGDVGFAGGRWVIFDTTMPQLAKYAADYMLRVPVIDRTGLLGAFDYKQPNALPDSEVDYSNPIGPFLNLIPEMGLKLERSRGLVETFVIDHVAKPSSN
jgi:uncharacterized protein (TIGR03435 family)